MNRPYQFIAFVRKDNVFCVRFQQLIVPDHQLDDLSAELGRLIDEENARWMILNLGPEEPDCLLSVFLAKLINLQRRLESIDGSLSLAHVSEHTRLIFRLAGIEKLFQFYEDEGDALNAIGRPEHGDVQLDDANHDGGGSSAGGTRG
jgi:hypothetical protein